MSKKIIDAFDEIKADEQLKASTLDFLREEMEKREKEKRPRRKLGYVLAPMMVMLFIVLGVSGYSAYGKATSYIGIDVNPSIELGINRMDKVVSVDCYNKDAEQLMEGIELKGLSYKEAVETLLNSEKFAVYEGEDYDLAFTVISKNEEEMIKNIEGCNGYGKYKATCGSANHELKEEAHAQEMSFGKYKAFLELKKVNPSITIEEVREMSMRQIHNLTHGGDGHGGQGQGSGLGNGQGQGGHEGQGAGSGAGDGHEGQGGYGGGQGSGSGAGDVHEVQGSSGG
ncbi:MAG: hypothetical protein RR472_05475, partial [Anaerovoracaceae bacterium]